MKVAFWLFLLAIGFGVACLGHAMATGTMLPQPDPTPEQVAHEQFHHPLGVMLFAMSGTLFAASLATATFASFAWVVKWLRSR
jgi:hypothetical protein